MKIPNISPSFSEKGFSELVNLFNVFSTSIGLENMKGQVIENITIPATTSIDVPHSLKVIPKYRIILRQIGDGSIVDGDNAWSDTLVSLRNTGSSSVIVSFFLIRN